MKKIIKNIISIAIFICSIVGLIFIGKLANELFNSPQLLIHITDPYPFSYYQVQDKVVEGWKNYCIIGIVFLSLIAIISLANLIFINLPTSNKKEEKRLVRKNKKIEKLQAELEELKKD